MSVATLVPETEFDAAKEYGKLFIGMEVEASTDPHGTNPGWGIICGIEGQSVHLWFAANDSNIGARFGILEDCWFINDPRVKRQPGLINDAERRAVFWLSDNQKKFEGYSEQILALTETCETLVVREKSMLSTIDKLEAEVKKLQLQMAARKGN